MSLMTRSDLLAAMRHLDACDEATLWVEATDAPPADLWARCERGDWMIWLACEADVGARTLREIACDCAERVLHVYEAKHPDDPRPRQAVEAARRFARGEASESELDAAWDAAWDAACAAAAARAAAKDAAWAAAAACAAAWAAAGSAAWATARDAARDAARAAARAADRAAAWDADRAAAWDAETRAQADLVRARLPWATVEAALRAALGVAA